MTLYDDHSYYTDGYSSDGRVGKMSATYPECQTDIRYNEYYDSTTGYGYQDERLVQRVLFGFAFQSTSEYTGTSEVKQIRENDNVTSFEVFEH